MYVPQAEGKIMSIGLSHHTNYIHCDRYPADPTVPYNRAETGDMETFLNVLAIPCKLAVQAYRYSRNRMHVLVGGLVLFVVLFLAFTL